jgi:ankyrin repeat protein
VFHFNCLQNQFTALTFAAARGHLNIVRVLLEASTGVSTGIITSAVACELTVVVRCLHISS